MRQDGSDDTSFMTTLVEELQQQSTEQIEKILNEGIQKGIISLRLTDVVVVRDMESSKLLLRRGGVIDYLGAEKIEQLEKDLAAVKKLNSDLHNSLTAFYENTKENQWLKRS